MLYWFCSHIYNVSRFFYFNDKQNEVPSLSIFTMFGHEIIMDNIPTDGRICESWFYIAVNKYPSRFFVLNTATIISML
jgi:hypothetical protein